MKFTIFTIMGLASTVFSARSVFQERDALSQLTDEIMFQQTIEEFANSCKTKPGVDGMEELIWESDWDDCYAAWEKPHVWSFKNCCDRLVFGYHNYKHQGRFTKRNKALIDAQVFHDLEDECDHESDKSDRLDCREVAEIYHKTIKMAHSQDTD